MARWFGGEVTGYHAYSQLRSTKNARMHRTHSDLERLALAFITHSLITRDLTLSHVKPKQCKALVEEKRFFS